MSPVYVPDMRSAEEKARDLLVALLKKNGFEPDPKQQKDLDQFILEFFYILEEHIRELNERGLL